MLISLRILTLTERCATPTCNSLLVAFLSSSRVAMEVWRRRPVYNAVLRSRLRSPPCVLPHSFRGSTLQMVLRLIPGLRTVPIVSMHFPNSRLEIRCSLGFHLRSATLVGATENVNPEKGAALSAGGFSNYFARPSWRKSILSLFSCLARSFRS